MSGVPSRQARLAHAAKHAELWNAGKKDEWVASWRTICPGEVRMFDPVGTEEKHGFDTATSEAFEMFQSILKIKMITVQVNGNEMAWVCENHFGTESNVQMAYSIETFAWDDDGICSSRPTTRCRRPLAPAAILTGICSSAASSPLRV
jgi:hypothetical protein